MRVSPVLTLDGLSHPTRGLLLDLTVGLQVTLYARDVKPSPTRARSLLSRLR